MNEKIIGVEVSGEVYPIKDEETSGKTQTLESKVSSAEERITNIENTLEDKVDKSYVDNNFIEKSEFNDNTFITPAYDSTKISDVSGGYKVIGKMIILNMRFRFRGTVGTVIDVASIPNAANNGAELIIGDWDNDSRTSEYALAYNGNLRIRVPTAGSIYCVSGIYMTA